MQLTRRGLLLAMLCAAFVECGSKSEESKKDSPPEAAADPSSEATKEPPAPPPAAPRELAPEATLSEEKLAGLGGREALASDEHVKRFIAERNTRDWYGFYIGERKVGYLSLTLRPTVEGEPGQFVSAFELHMRADGDEMDMSEFAFYEAEPPYRTLEIHTLESGNAEKVERIFKRDGDMTRVETTIDGERRGDSWAPEMCDTLDEMIAASAPELGKVKKGLTAKFCSFSASEQVQEVDEYRVAGVERRSIKGVEVEVIQLEQRMDEGNQWLRIEVSDAGTMLRGNLGPGIQFKLEEEDIAKSDVQGVDVDYLSVKIDKDLGKPGDVQELRLKASFAESFQPLPSTPDQQVEKLEDGRYLLTLRSVPGAPVTEEQRGPALAATPEVNAKDPAIVAMAKKITKGLTSDREKVSALNHWVYTNLDKSLSTNLGSATQVLDKRTGDCTEHTILLLALIRSIGIPARELGGLTYMNGKHAGFGWHAWTEVAIDGKWVQVDPSWDEEIANATHIKLAIGDDDDSIVNMGTMSLEAL